MWNIKNALLLMVLATAGCASENHPLPTVKADDPVIRLNSGMWNSDENALIKPPVEAGGLFHG